jgi:hypothetical protein
VLFCAGIGVREEANRCRYEWGDDFRTACSTVEELWGEGLE